MDAAAKEPKRPPKRPHGGLSDRTATGVIVVVTAMWAANILAGMLQLNGYQPSESINGIFLTVVGGALVLRSKGRDDE